MYVLLLASALVWGWVFIKIFNVVFKGDEVPVRLVKNKNASTFIAEKDSFELLANYRDPFLKKTSHAVSYAITSPSSNSNGGSVRAAVAKQKSEKIIPKKEERVIDWNFIAYKGRITRKSNGKVLSLLTINGGDYSLEEGKEVQLVTLVKSYHDSIEVRYDGIKKHIKRNQN
ncbi:MAG: hypothetical protein JWO58_3108 [Chitinophagaceae bacterium]|nr:hypothetical protein [Chitinophagaceae bacterium]